MRRVTSIQAFAGRGLDGDRYTYGRGVFLPPPGTREVTLIAAEALAEFTRETGRPLSAEDSRRNLLTTGVDLNSLVGETFRVGPVWLEGTELCQPCAHLVRLTGWREILPGLIDRGGLATRILNDGRLTVGDPVVLATAPPETSGTAVGTNHAWGDGKDRSPSRQLVGKGPRP